MYKSICSEKFPTLLLEIWQETSSVQFSPSVVSICHPMDCSAAGLPVHHQLPELTQLMSIESVMPSNRCRPLHLLVMPSNRCRPPLLLVMPSNRCRPPLLLPSVFPSIRVFSSESVLCIRWPKYWSFSFNISPSNEYSELISFRMDWLDLLAVQGTLKSLLQHHSSKASVLRCSAFFIVQLSHPYMTARKIIALTRPLLAK